MKPQKETRREKRRYRDYPKGGVIKWNHEDLMKKKKVRNLRRKLEQKRESE